MNSIHIQKCSNLWIEAWQIIFKNDFLDSVVKIWNGQPSVPKGFIDGQWL
jgi:hypothetical protein